MRLALSRVLVVALALALWAPAAEASRRLDRPCAPWDARRTADEAAAALELQGGTRILLHINEAVVRKEVLEQLLADVRRVLREAHINYGSLAVRDGGLEVRIQEQFDLQQALSKLAEVSPKAVGEVRSTVEVKDLGNRMVRLTPTEQLVDDHIRATHQCALAFLDWKVRGFASGGVQPEGRIGILVLLPGVKNEPARGLLNIGSMAEPLIVVEERTVPGEAGKK